MTCGHTERTKTGLWVCVSPPHQSRDGRDRTIAASGIPRADRHVMVKRANPNM